MEISTPFQKPMPYQHRKWIVREFFNATVEYLEIKSEDSMLTKYGYIRND